MQAAPLLSVTKSSDYGVDSLLIEDDGDSLSHETYHDELQQYGNIFGSSPGNSPAEDVIESISLGAYGEPGMNNLKPNVM
jgi:hypothetical protein